MASLVEIPQSKSTATLEVLGYFGVQQEHLKRIRSDKKYASSVAKFMVHQSALETTLVQAYALNFVLVARTLIELLKPKLSPEELKYVEQYGPEILKEELLYEFYTTDQGCEGGPYRLKAETLENLAKKRLSQAGTSEERQNLLRDLTSYADADFLNKFPPKELGDIKHQMKNLFREGRLARLKEAAILLNASQEIQDFLELLYEQAIKLVRKE